PRPVWRTYRDCAACPCEDPSCGRRADTFLTPACGSSSYAAFLVAAAFRAAARNSAGPFVATALRAAVLRAAAPRRRAAWRVCRLSAVRDADRRGSCFKALGMARDRVRETLRPCRRAAREAYAALLRVFALALFGGRPSFTPARRALLKPMAIACLA